MKQAAYTGLALAVLSGIAMGLTPVAHATPNPDRAVLNLRVINDCSASLLLTGERYPGSISITDHVPRYTCGGSSNLHAWSFSEGGATAAVFNNNACFQFGCDVVISGGAASQAAIRISPWWSKYVDGRINVRTTDGEIACLGGRMPYYSFTANHGIRYAKNTVIHLEMHYNPQGLTSANPATIRYVVGYGGNTYLSPVLRFNQGNPANDPPYGQWGMLNDGRVGGLMQPLWGASDPSVNRTVTVNFTNIFFSSHCDEPVPAVRTTWGRLKSLYR